MSGRHWRSTATGPGTEGRRRWSGSPGAFDLGQHDHAGSYIEDTGSKRLADREPEDARWRGLAPAVARQVVSDNMLDRLLSCMGYRLEVIRRPVKQDLGRSPERSWRLQRQLSTHLTSQALREWRPTIVRNLKRLRGSVRGQPHLHNLDRWQLLIEHDDLPGLRQVLTGLDTDSVQMREVSPMGGLLPQNERLKVLSEMGPGSLDCDDQRRTS